MLQPSAFEGWSTVVEDAKTLGKQILVSGIEVHREQLGTEHPCYIDTYDAEAWARAMLAAWDQGVPGPCLEREARALEQMRLRSLELGRHFVQLMKIAMDPA